MTPGATTILGQVAAIAGQGNGARVRRRCGLHGAAALVRPSAAREDYPDPVTVPPSASDW